MARSSASNTQLMLVEDEPVVALDIRHRLTRLGYAVPLAATSGEDAVRLALEHSPDLILMDIMLEGGLDGIDAATRIRDERNIPVIYLTGATDEQTLQRAKTTGPFGYIIKPFEDRELHSCIEMALYKHQMDRRLLENERRLSTTLKSIADAVISTDGQGRIQFFNPVAEALTGWKVEEVMGKRFVEALKITSKDQNTGIMDITAQVLRQNATLRFSDLNLYDKQDVISRPIDLSVAAIHGENGKVCGMVLVLRDITETKRSEEALRQSLKNLRRTLEETVTALAMTAEKRDPYTAGHQQRVARLASAIATEIGLPEDQVECIRVASLLHDIGKIYIPAEILAKPSTLTQMEMGLIKTHSEVGHDILQGVSFPWPIANIVLQHHERLDGSGYPAGMAGDAILMEAKIIMVADVVEAMSSHRPYRAALGLPMALAEIERHSGRRYESSAVDACLKLFASGNFSFEDT